MILRDSIGVQAPPEAIVRFFEEAEANYLQWHRLGPLARRAHRKLLDAVREHTRVEGVNMKRIVEQQEPARRGSF